MCNWCRGHGSDLVALFRYAIPVRHRVAAVVKHWVEHHFYDFKNDKKLFRNLLEFARGEAP